MTAHDVLSPSTNLSGNRAHSLKNAAGKDDGNHVMTYSSSDILSHSDIQLTQGGLVLVGILRGGDYSDGLHGCGVATAHGLAKAGFGDSLLRAALALSRSDFEAFLVGWREELRAELKANVKGCLPRKSPALAKTVPEDFPDINVVLAYTNPVTSEAKGPTHRNAVVDWDKEPDLGRIAGLCEMYFEWGVRQVIIKRFRTVLWPAAVLRILRRAVVLKDRKAARVWGQLAPETPRKNGKEWRAPPGTPSSMIAKHFSGMALSSPQRGGADQKSDPDTENEDDEDDPLIVKIHSSRQHASTDKILEYRLEIAPAQLVRLCEAGIKGLRTALPPDLSDDDDDEDDDDDDEGGGKRKGKKGKKPPPDPNSHLRLWLPACMVAMVEPEMVDEFEGVQKWKAEKKAAKGKKAAAPEKATGAATVKKTKAKAKVPTVAAVPEEEEEESGEESELPVPPKPKTSKAKTVTNASVGLNKPASRPLASGGASKIDEFFGAKKTISKIAGGKPAKTTMKSSTSKVPNLFKDLSSDSGEESRTSKRPPPASQKTSSISNLSPPKISAASRSSSSRILSFLDSRHQHSATSPSKASASSPSRARTPQPFPMNFDAYPLNGSPEPGPDEDLFTSSADPSSHSSPLAHTRTRSTLSSSSSDTHPSAPVPIHKSPRRSEKHSSSRKNPSKKVQRTPRKEEEESSESDSDLALGRRPPSPSPLKGQAGLPTALGTNMYRVLNARREKEESDHAPSPSLTQPKKLIPQAASSNVLARPSTARKRRPPASLPADMTIISISSGSEPDDPPPPKPMKKVAPLEIARARLGMANTGNKPPRRRYDSDDVIDLT